MGVLRIRPVTKGMNVVDAIEAESTATRAGHQDVPVETIMINKATSVP